MNGFTIVALLTVFALTDMAHGVCIIIINTYCNNVYYKKYWN